MSPTRSLRDRLALFCVVAGLAAIATTGFGQVPGPEVFLKEPETALELWDAADYLVRTGQAKQAVPYLTKFLKSAPDDDALLQIRDRYGVGSILRLDDFPETRPLAKPIAEALAAAVQRSATRPERIEKFIAGLTLSGAEQQYAVEQLREAGPYAVPYLVQALAGSGLSEQDRAALARNIGRLDRSAVPPLIATLDDPNTRIAADAADALGELGDTRAVPWLVALAARNAPDTSLGASSRRAIYALTGRPFESRFTSPVRYLTDEALKYHRHAVRFPAEPVIVWVWDDATRVPAPRRATQSQAEEHFGVRLAREALRIDPTDVPAQVALLSLLLEKAVERVGYAAFPAGDPSNVFADALAAGPNVLGRVVRMALADGKLDLAAAATTALGQVTDRDALATDRRVNPLIETLSAPSARAQLAAAKALVLLDPRRPFPGSSRVVPTLARFVANQPGARAVVIDGNLARGGQQVGFLKALGYDATLAQTGADGFRDAAEAADVELILIDPHFIQGSWRLLDTVSNLRADARTAGIPIYIVGPKNLQFELDDFFVRFPGVKYLVTPTSPALLERQLGGRPMVLSDGERVAMAQEAAQLLSLVSSRSGSPFESDLSRAEPSLAIGLATPTTSLAATTALGDVPDPAAQRALASALLDPSRPSPARLSAANQLARNIQRFGPLVTSSQEAALLAALDQAAEPALRTALAAVVGALRPKPALTGQRLRRETAPAPPPDQATPPPAPAPSPPAEDAASPSAAEATPPPANANP